MHTRRPRPTGAGLFLAASLLVACRADEWPTWRHDARRSGVSAEKLSWPLGERWTYTPLHPPEPAWEGPPPKSVESHLELPRLGFDTAYHVAAVGDSVFFGSSADGKVYALQAADGTIRWEFFTDGPVRMAPTVADGRVFFGSDDGHVYAVDAATGALLWRHRAAPETEQVIGNGRVISLWPVRTGVLVDRGVAYVGAGVFPAEGLCLYALDAATGRRLWANDGYGQGGRAGISPQGYLLLSDDRIFLPSARTMPAGFRRADGKFLFHVDLNWRRTGLFGGTHDILYGQWLFSGGEQLVAIRQADGALAHAEKLPANDPALGPRRLAIADDILYLLADDRLSAVRLADWRAEQDRRNRYGEVRGRFLSLKEQVEGNREWIATLQRKMAQSPADPAGREEGQTRLREALARRDKLAADFTTAAVKMQEAANAPDAGVIWRAPCPATNEVILTADAVVTGGAGSVRAFDRRGGALLWQADLPGRAVGLAVANGRLLVSADTGRIHCFTHPDGVGGAPRAVSPDVAQTPFPKDERGEQAARLAERVLAEGGPTRGYALLLGAGDGRLALELARRTELRLHVAEADPDVVAAARRALSAAGVYGTRVTVLQADPRGLVCPDYFADLIVCAGGFEANTTATPPGEVLRMLKPWGGRAFVGALAAADGSGAHARLAGWVEGFRALLAENGETHTDVTVEGAWARIVRGALPGAGEWTHQYADAGNTACSGDRRVAGPLGVLWFGGPGPTRMPSRHDSAAAPLAFGGRLFVQGENVLMAHDAYNGLPLWRRELPGAIRLHTQGGAPGNLTGGGSNLFVVLGARGLRLDAATGATTREYVPPPAALAGVASGQWNYVAYDAGLLFGSVNRRADWGAQEEGALFALDAETGATAWALTNRQIVAGTVAIGEGRVLFVDRRIAEEQRRAVAAEERDPPRKDRRGQPIPPDVRLAVCLDARSGATLWEQPLYVGDCLGEEVGDLTGMAARGVYLLCGQPWNGHFWKEFLAGAFSRRSLIALDAATGRPLWSGRKGYRSRPLIVGETIVAEPWAYELRTGKRIERRHPLTGEPSAWQMSRPGHHCGNIAAAADMLFCRSGSLAYYDLAADFGTAHFGAQRPGCWINCIPANGLALMPEASAGCVCPYALQCTIALRPRRTNRAWGVFSAAGASTPIRRLNLNFGAPGDRRDAAGELWLAYPRPYTGRLVTEVPVQSAALTNAGFVCRGGAATENWIGQSWWTGVTNLSVLLHDDTDGAIPATVRLHFREPDGLLPTQRVFGVAIEGGVRMAAFDPAREGGGTNTVVREFRGLRVTGPLDVALIPSRGMPLLCGLEVIREPALPQLADSSFACTAGVPAIVTLPATFEDGAPMAVTIVVATPPAHGALTRLSGRRYAYRADPAYSGSDAIVWRAAEAGRETRSAMVAITVEPDRVAPRLVAARSVGREDRIALDFDEPLDPATATNAAFYRVDKDVSVYAASLRTNGTSVRLTTAPLKEGETYSVVARGVRDRAGPPNVATNADAATFTHALAGFALREVWRGVAGAEMACFTNGALARTPDATEEVAPLESPGTEAGDNYAARISGFIRPRVTAEYVLWCAADDACELWLAPDATPANRVRVALVPAWTQKRQWDKVPEQKSEPIPMKAGERYSFEVRHKEAAGSDHVSVAWEAPGVPRAVIPGSCLLLPPRW